MPLLVDAPEPLAPLPGMPVVLEEPLVPPLALLPAVPVLEEPVPAPPCVPAPVPLVFAPAPEPLDPAPPLVAPPPPAWAKTVPHERVKTKSAAPIGVIRVFISPASSHIALPFPSGAIMIPGSANAPRTPRKFDLGQKLNNLTLMAR